MPPSKTPRFVAREKKTISSLYLQLFFRDCAPHKRNVKVCENRVFAFTNERTDGDNSQKLLWVKAFLGGTRWLREGNRNLLRLLTILERMTNDNRVGSNVDLIFKLYYNFDQNGPGQGWSDPVLLSRLLT